MRVERGEWRGGISRREENRGERSKERGDMRGRGKREEQRREIIDKRGERRNDRERREEE